MTTFFNYRFPYFDKLHHRLLHVVIILVFSVVFLVVFEPFNIRNWISYPGWLIHIGLIAIGLCLSFIIAISQLIIRTLIVIKEFKVGHLILWLVVEMLVIGVALTLMFANYQNGFFTELYISLKFTSIGLVLPYSFSILILALIYQKNAIHKSASNKNIELINFKDERGQVKFSVQKKTILYLESADNYINVFYNLDGKIQKEMVRNSMKKIEDQLNSFGMVRCHRSFMVNMENVQWLKKDGRNYQLKVKSSEMLIPVSRSFTPQFKTLIQD